MPSFPSPVVVDGACYLCPIQCLLRWERIAVFNGWTRSEAARFLSPVASSGGHQDWKRPMTFGQWASGIGGLQCVNHPMSHEILCQPVPMGVIKILIMMYYCNKDNVLDGMMAGSTTYEDVRDPLINEAGFIRRLKESERCVWGHSTFRD